MEKIKDLTAQEIELYLLGNPEFFLGRDRLIKKLHLAHESGGAISLLERQNGLLRQQNENLDRRLNDLISNAKSNDRMFQHLQRMVLASLSATDVSEFESILNTNLCQYFNVDAFRLLVVPDPDQAASWVVPESVAESLLMVGERLSGSKAYCGSMSAEQMTSLFEQSFKHGSVAIARNEFQGTKVVICLASHDENYYRNSMDTLFLNYLAEVTSRMTSRLIQNQ